MDDCANPLFLGWVKQWWDQAKERNTKGVLAYRTAYESLRACPVRFEHPDQLLALKGFGPKTCSRLLERLVQHCEAHGLPVPAKKRLPAAAAQRLQDLATNEEEEAWAATEAAEAAEAAAPRRPPRRRKPYVPVLRQGGYAILVALSAPEAAGHAWLAKDEIVALAQPHCDASFTVRPPGKFYTAWDSIKTLLNNDLVAERRRPSKRYALTDDGRAMAAQLRQAAGLAAGRPGDGAPVQPSGGDEDAAPAVAIPDGPPAGEADAGLPRVTPLVLPAGSYSVHLVLDVRERVTGQRSYMEDELGKKHGVQPLVRALSLGDALWVARCKDPVVLRRLRASSGSGSGSGGDTDADYSEIVLDWVVERKRQDDLVYSIRDGRFREQKFRLRRSGVRHVVYVVEESGLDADMQHRYEEAMQSAVASTQVVNGFFVKKTHSVDDSIAYLARLTHRLERHYADRPLHVVPTPVLTTQNHLGLLAQLREMSDGAEVGVSYTAFASLTSKSELLTLRDVFLKMLMCTRGITGERALEIQKLWPTPHAFVQAYREAEGGGGGGGGGGGNSDDAATAARKRKRDMVSDQLGALPGTKRRVTKVLSAKLAEVWADAEGE